MKSGFDEATSHVLQLFPGLYEQIIAWRNFDRYPFPRVSCPNVKTWVTRATMDSQKIEVRVETRQNGVFLSIFNEIGGGRGE